jgi:hypothetical protein
MTRLGKLLHDALGGVPLVSGTGIVDQRDSHIHL